MALDAGLKTDHEGVRAEQLSVSCKQKVLYARVEAGKECKGLGLESILKAKLPGFFTN